MIFRHFAIENTAILKQKRYSVTHFEIVKFENTFSGL